MINIPTGWHNSTGGPSCSPSVSCLISTIVILFLLSGAINESGPSLKIPASAFYSSGVYDVMVEVRRSERKAYAYIDAYVTVDVVCGDSLLHFQE